MNDYVSTEAECHGCWQRMSGYQLGELIVEHGWRLHSIRPNQQGGFAPTELFVLCGDCEPGDRPLPIIKDPVYLRKY